jgi:hypothetical protein
MTSRSHGGIVDRIKRLPWWLAPVVAAAVAVAFIAFGAIFTSESGDLWFELAKAGVQLLAIVVLGSAVAAAFRVLDDRREGRRIGASEQREEDRSSPLSAERSVDCSTSIALVSLPSWSTPITASRPCGGRSERSALVRPLRGP